MLLFSDWVNKKLSVVFCHSSIEGAKYYVRLLKEQIILQKKTIVEKLKQHGKLQFEKNRDMPKSFRASHRTEKALPSSASCGWMSTWCVRGTMRVEVWK